MFFCFQNKLDLVAKSLHSNICMNYFEVLLMLVYVTLLPVEKKISHCSTNLEDYKIFIS